jgi:hypothetical protein
MAALAVISGAGSAVAGSDPEAGPATVAFYVA